MTAYLKLELHRALRDRRYLGIVLAWPVASYLLFSTVFGSAADRAEGLSPHTEIMIAMATFGAIGAVLLATGPRIASERQSGWTRQLGLTPLAPSAVLCTRLFAALLLTAPSICLTFVVAFAVKGVVLPLWVWPAMFGLLIVGSVPFAALGFLIGGLSDGDSAVGVTVMAYLVLAALGGLWMPTRILPGPMQGIAHALPSNALAQLGWKVAAGGAPPLGALAVLAAWGVGLGFVATALVRRVGS
jgi:ABC-2 type transport system permease protein